MEKWLESVYSDGTDQFMSNPNPKIGDKIELTLRCYADAPVNQVILRTEPNGVEMLTPAKKTKEENGLAYYTAELEITENHMPYHWYLVSDDIIYYYNQKEISPRFPDPVYDFQIVADYKQPDWVKDSVFYQIFPERFYNGNPDNDVKDGEYSVNGHETIQMKNWNDIPLEYNEGFCLDFYGGDLEGIKEKIPYLKELGVNAVYLNPIFTGPSVHKYDCIDYTEVDPHFGGNKALEELSKALHENGMKLILDISINHTGSNHKWFNRDGLYFDKSIGAYNNPDSDERDYYFFDEDNNYKSWFDVADMPTLNFTSEQLRDKVYRKEDSILKKWLKEPYNIDGWRFDVADTFARNNEIQLAQEVWPEIRESIHDVNDNAYILAEDWGDCYKNLQGNMWDSPMNYYGSARIIRQFLGEPDLFAQRHDFLKDIKYNLPAEDFEARVKGYLGKLPFALWQNQFNLIDSHDVSRLHNNPEINPDDYKGALMLQFALIGAPTIYYGDELGVEGTIENNEGCRYPMPWDKAVEENKTFDFFKKLTHLKRSSKAFTEGGMKFLYAKGDVIALARFYGNEMYTVIMSKSGKEEKVIIPFGSIGSNGPKETIDYFGSKIDFKNLNNGDVEITLKPHQALLIDCSVD